MFSFLKKTNAVLYSETEKLKRIFQSGEQIPYFNQMRVIFEGIINLIESKFYISLKEKTLGQKIHNPHISHYLYNVITLNENEVEEFVDVTNEGTIYIISF